MVPYITILSSASYLFTSMFILTRNRQRMANIFFSIGMFFIALSELFLVFLHYTFARHMDVSWLELSVASETFALPFWFLFVLTFNRHESKKMLLKWRYYIGLSIVISGLLAFYIYKDQFFADSDGDIYISRYSKYYIFYSILTCSLILWKVEKLFSEMDVESDGDSTNRHVTFCLGLAILFATLVIKNSTWLVYSVFVVGNVQYYSLLLFVAVCLSGYAVVRHRLLDVDIFVSRYIVYRTVSLFAIGGYLVLVGITAGWINDIGNNLFFSFLFIFAASTVMAFLYNSAGLRYRVRLFINRNFFKYKHDFHNCWMEVVETIPSSTTRSMVEERMTFLVKDRIKAEEVTFWRYNGNGFCHNTDQLDINEQAISLILNRNEILNTAGSWCNIKEQETVSAISGSAGQYYLVAPVSSGSSVLGIVTVGKHILGESYNPDDMELTWAIIRQGAATMTNMDLTDQLVAARENEVFSHFSSFVIHDLKNFTQTLSLVLQNVERHADNKEFLTDAFKTIGVVVGKMNSITANLSTVSGQIFPISEQVDIGLWLNRYISTMPTDNIFFEPPESSVYVMLDCSLFERVVHNFIINSRESDQGRDVSINIKLYIQDGAAVISFEDNGSGIPSEFIVENLFKPFRTTKPKGLGIGLFECKKIVEAHGGNISVESEFSKGTTIKVVLPLAGVSA